MCAAALQTHFLQNICHTVADGRSGSQRQVHNAERHAQTAGSFLCHQLAHTGDLESGLFDNIGNGGDVTVAGLCQCCTHHARAGNAHVDFAVRFAGSVECTSHEGVILGGIAEHHQLGGADAVPVSGALCHFPDNASHFGNCVHVDTGLGRTDVYRGADEIGAVQCLGNALDQGIISGAEALVYQCGITADEVYAHRLGGTVQRQRKTNRINAGVSACDHGNGGDGDPLVNNRDSVLFADVLAGFYQILSIAADLVVNFVTGPVCVRVNAVQQRNTHGDGSHVQVFVVDHIDGFQYIMAIEHTFTASRLNFKTVSSQKRLKCGAWS